MTKHITVGYDSSPSSVEAVSWAAADATARGAALKIVSCYDLPIVGETGGAWLTTSVISAIVEGTRRAVEAAQRAIAAEHPLLEVTTVVSAGPAREVLLDGLDPNDLLVVGASSHEGAVGFWLGNTARWATRHAPCPVVVVRGPASRGRPDRIVVGTDGSSAAEAALLWAADEADRHGCELIVVHGWEYPYLGLDTAGEQARDFTRVDGACVLERAVETARERCGVTVTGSLVEGRIVTALLDSVRDGDVLVMASSGKGAIVASLLGSTVNTVLEQSTVPVVVVPSPIRN
jgi:nucleotide-binding universal stress UspA family protein